MNSPEDRKRLAAARKAARIRRIRTIRSGVTAAGVSLVIVFSSVVAQRGSGSSASAASPTSGNPVRNSAGGTSNDRRDGSASAFVSEDSSAVTAQPEVLTTSQS